MFDSSFPACTFFFKVEISSHTPIPFFMPGSVHSGSRSWDDCSPVFPDKWLVIYKQNRDSQSPTWTTSLCWGVVGSTAGTGKLFFQSETQEKGTHFGNNGTHSSPSSLQLWNKKLNPFSSHERTLGASAQTQLQRRGWMRMIWLCFLWWWCHHIAGWTGMLAYFSVSSFSSVPWLIGLLGGGGHRDNSAEIQKIFSKDLSEPRQGRPKQVSVQHPTSKTCTWHRAWADCMSGTHLM